MRIQEMTQFGASIIFVIMRLPASVAKLPPLGDTVYDEK